MPKVGKAMSMNQFAGYYWAGHSEELELSAASHEQQPLRCVAYPKDVDIAVGTVVVGKKQSFYLVLLLVQLMVVW